MNRNKTRFREMLQQAEPYFLNALRRAARLMEQEKISAQALVALGTDQIERLLVLQRVKDAPGLARRIPAALNYLAEKFPDAGLPVIVPKPSAWHALPRRRAEPRQFRMDMVAGWRAEVRRRSSGFSATYGLRTGQTYRRSCREFFATSLRAGTEVDENFGIEALTYSDVALNTFDQIRHDGYSKKTNYKILSGLIAVARDVLTPGHPHVVWLETQRGGRSMQASRALPHEAEIKLASIMTSGGVQLLLQAPDQIEDSASGSHCGRKDRIARHQYAFLLGLKLDHPGLTEKQGAQLNLVNDITVTDGRHFLLLSPIAKGGQCTPEPMGSQSVRRLNTLWAVKRRDELMSPLLFPSRKHNFGPGKVKLGHNDGGSDELRRRKTSSILEGLYKEIRVATGLELTFMGIQDLVARVLLESGIDPFIVARRAGYKHVRSLETRMRAHFRTEGAP